ncbi:MAG: DUF177 domain-containing protein [Clostridia bacterium]|nr:DUF177 domain-containing protein [Clostridia bacterium]
MLNISKALKNPGQAYPVELACSFEAMEIMGDEVSLRDVKFTGNYFGAGEEVSVSGEICAKAHTHCANCLVPVVKPIKAELNEVFVKGGDGEDAYPLQGYEIDLEPVIREALLLELPMRFLCSDNCKGLCPVCGKNRNKELCTCTSGEDSKNPFSALSSLLSDHNDEEV